MVERVPPIEGKARSRLEVWLVRAIQGDRFAGLPLYYPLRGVIGHRPERYARRLLADLGNQALDSVDRERTQDDGRAFRGWAEAQPLGTVPVARSLHSSLARDLEC